MSTTRKEGYYWVRPASSKWVIAYFGSGNQYVWWIPFENGTYSDDAFFEIDERRIQREQ